MLFKRLAIAAAKETARAAGGFALFIIAFHVFEYLENRGRG
jgi:hypothetical protein